jgi:hypothetical protein
MRRVGLAAIVSCVLLGAPPSWACAAARHSYGALLGFDASGGWWTLTGHIARPSDGGELSIAALGAQRWDATGRREMRALPDHIVPRRILWVPDPGSPEPARARVGVVREPAPRHGHLPMTPGATAT